MPKQKRREASRDRKAEVWGDAPHAERVKYQTTGTRAAKKLAARQDAARRMQEMVTGIRQRPDGWEPCPLYSGPPLVLG